METFLPNSVKAILLALLAIVFALAWMSRKLPQVAWLRSFRFPQSQLSEEQRAQRRRSGNRLAALQFILGGLALPFLYLISTVFSFSTAKTIPMTIVSACGILCIALGIWIFVRNR